MSFPEETRAGMRAQATCFVQEGDRPLTLVWWKDGRPLDPRLEARVSSIDTFTSILVIDRASAAHTGNYTCLVTNAASTVTTSARLTVSGRRPTTFTSNDLTANAIHWKTWV